MARVHVVPRPNGWAVKSEGASRAYRTYATKDDALREAISHARQNGYDVVVHGRDNRIQRIITPREINEGRGCFLTTACVEYYNLPDNCYQLRTLRFFRDEILNNTSEGKTITKQYYKIAPEIVTLLKNDKDKHLLFKLLMDEINSACEAVKQEDYTNAILTYKQAVEKLALRYRILI